MAGEKVFVSSTWLDNARRRKRVEEAILTAEMVPVGMERFTASTEPTVEECLRMASEADVLVGVVAWRYGWIPPGKERSITELEYEAASERLMFVLDPEVPVHPVKDFDDGPDRGENLARLDAFKQRFSGDQMPALFDEENLGLKVNKALEDWRKRRSPQAAGKAPLRESPSDIEGEILVGAATSSETVLGAAQGLIAQQRAAQQALREEFPSGFISARGGANLCFSSREEVERWRRRLQRYLDNYEDKIQSLPPLDQDFHRQIVFQVEDCIERSKEQRNTVNPSGFIACARGPIMALEEWVESSSIGSTLPQPARVWTEDADSIDWCPVRADRADHPERLSGLQALSLEILPLRRMQPTQIRVCFEGRPELGRALAQLFTVDGDRDSYWSESERHSDSGPQRRRLGEIRIEGQYVFVGFSEPAFVPGMRLRVTLWSKDLAYRAVEIKRSSFLS